MHAKTLSENKPVMLIIPDVHGRMFWRSAVKKYPDLPTIFLGDYLDPYQHEGILPSEALVEFKDILEFKKQNSDRVTLLLGNHDVHYFDAHLNSSRKDWLEQDNIRIIFEENLKYFALSKYLKLGEQEYLFSHAGMLPGWLQLHFPNLDLSKYEELSDFLNSLLLRDLDEFRDIVSNALMNISPSRGGYDKYPSMVWTDLEDYIIYFYEHLQNVRQIFGHTKLACEPLILAYLVCLDCRKAFLLKENGDIVDA